jgi:hypothetical protein
MARNPYVDGPLLARARQCVHRIACDHMSGLLSRSHMTAAKMGSATRGPNSAAAWQATGFRGVSRVLGSIDHTNCSVFQQASGLPGRAIARPAGEETMAMGSSALRRQSQWRVGIWKPSPRSHRRSLACQGERRWRRGMAAIPLVDQSEQRPVASSALPLAHGHSARR